MHDSFGVDVVKSLKTSLNKSADLFLSRTFVSCNSIEKLSTFDWLLDKEVFVFLVVELIKLSNIGVVHFTQHLDFFQKITDFVWIHFFLLQYFDSSFFLSRFVSA